LAHRCWRDGVSAVSIRDVAAEAGLAVGSVRHVFGSKAELLEYSMALVHEQTRDRVAAHFAIKDPRKFAEAVLAELLPLDDQLAETEMAVNKAVVCREPVTPPACAGWRSTPNRQSPKRALQVLTRLRPR
jgi:AcrR family transcriptional regulator